MDLIESGGEFLSNPGRENGSYDFYPATGDPDTGVVFPDDHPRRESSDETRSLLDHYDPSDFDPNH